MKEIVKAYELLEELRIYETDLLNRAGVKESRLSKRISESITELRQAEVNFISVNNCVSGSLPLSDVIKGEEGKYYCGLLDGNDMISTQGTTIDEVFENMADAYRTIKAAQQ